MSGQLFNSEFLSGQPLPWCERYGLIVITIFVCLTFGGVGLLVFFLIKDNYEANDSVDELDQTEEEGLYGFIEISHYGLIGWTFMPIWFGMCLFVFIQRLCNVYFTEKKKSNKK